MGRVAVLILVALAGVACTATVKWEKTGVDATERQRDETDCTSQASRQSSVPTAQTYGTVVDPQPSQARPVDSTAYEDCMRTRGYERIAPTQ